MLIEPPARILVTGSAGFIGFHVARDLLVRGYRVVGIDNLNEYYDVSLKRARLAELADSDFEFQLMDFSNRDSVDKLMEQKAFDAVVHLGAQAGVRFSIENPYTYIQSNVVGTVNLLEAAKRTGVRHFAYASSSSVYGSNEKLPFDESDRVDHPISLYAATKKSNELMAHSYSHLFGLPTTGLRFFTVYGPWGRPDMAVFKFTRAIIEDRPIDVYNSGHMKRDFTYIDDIVSGTVEAMRNPATADPSDPVTGSATAPYRVFNIGNHESVELLKFIETLELAIGKKAQLRLLPLQPGDVLETYASIDRLQKAVGYHPSTPIEVGLPRFVDWYRGYYGV